MSFSILNTARIRLIFMDYGFHQSRSWSAGLCMATMLSFFVGNPNAGLADDNTSLDESKEGMSCCKIEEIDKLAAEIARHSYRSSPLLPENLRDLNYDS